MFSKPWKPVGALVVGLALSLVVAAAEGDKPQDKEEKKETQAQTTCPVMGGQINKASFADYNGKRVYFCCNGCPATFAKDPAKYVKKLEDAGVTLEKAPAKDTSKESAGGADAAHGGHQHGGGGGCH